MSSEDYYSKFLYFAYCWSLMRDDSVKTSPYKKGRRFEYLVRDELLKLGLIVFRTAKSSGRSRDAKSLYPPVDLIAFTKDGRALFVECKASRRLSPRDKKEMAGFVRLPGPYFVVTPDNLEEFLKRVREWAGGS
jgi:hypothetical protein